jgi:SNF2 family DNA or RNA helicase
MRDGTVPPWSRAGTFDLVIGDEIHRIANRNAAQKRVLALIKADRKLAISATFSGNKEEGAWSVLNWLWKDKYPPFWDWVYENLHVEDQKVSRSKTIKSIGGELNPGAIWDSIPCAVRHRTEDIGIELPEVIERIVKVPMGEVQRQQYDDFEQQAFAWLDDQPVGTPLPITQRIRLRQTALGQLKASEVIHRIDYRLTKMEQKVLRAWDAYRESQDGAVLAAPFIESYNEIRWKREKELDQFRLDEIFEKKSFLDQGVEFEDIETGELDIDFNDKGDQKKLVTIKEILGDLPDDEPVLIFTHSAKWARMAAASIDAAGIYGEARAWTGDLTSVQREGLKNIFGVLKPTRLKSKFSHTGIRILVCQIQAIAEGVDGFQHRCRCEIWASPSEDGLINTQAKGRLHRPGQTSPVQRWVLHSEDSIDTDVAESLEERWARMRKLYKDDQAA